MSKYHSGILLSCCCLVAAGCMGQTIKSVNVNQDKGVQDKAVQDEATQDKATQDNAKTSESKEKTTPHPALTNPKLADKQAPETFRVKFETTKGDFIVEVTRDWSPNGADRFYNLVDIGYFNEIAIFRAIKGFMFQFGIHGVPAISEKWSDANIPDDPDKGISNKPGTITFAKSGAPNSRSTQFFINLGNNKMLDPQGFTPFGKVIEGMDVVSEINTQYGENSPDVQGRFQSQGNAFITKRFPKIDFIKSVTLIEEEK